MKKRFLAVFLALALCVGLAPTTAFAGGVDYVNTYQELLSRISAASDGYTSIYIDPDEDFGWPDNVELTVPKGGFNVVTSWEISSGVTLKFENGSGAIEGNELIINGTVVTSYSSQDSVFWCKRVVIGPTGTFACDDAGGPSFAIRKGVTWEVQEGATLNARIWLGGTLTGAGTVSGDVGINGGFVGQSVHGTLSGTLRMAGSVRIGGFSSEDPYDESITIPAGSHIKFECLETDIYGKSFSFTSMKGKLVLDGTISMRYPYRLSSDSSTPPDHPYITGSGTINYHNSKTIYCWMQMLQGDIADLVKYRDKYAAYIDLGVTINYDNPLGVFTDLKPNAFYLEPVAWAVTNGITTGKTATTFAPDLKCSHSEILTFLWRAAGSPESSAQPPIAMKGNEFYYKAVKWAAEKGMIDKNFKPNAACTRAYAVQYIWQAFGKPAPAKASPFTDIPAHWSSAKAAAWAAEKGITTGTTATTFNPSGICNRGQIVTFLYRAYK